MISYGDNSYQYSANGELESKTNASGTTSYSYDVLGNLTKVTLTDGTKITYVIDGANRRVGKKVNGTLTQGLLYQDSLAPVAELDSSGNVVSQFVYASGVNVPDYMIKGGVTYRIVTDHLGSVRLVMNVNTGDIVQKMEYDEFGQVIIDTNPGFQPFGFAGGIYDPETKLVHFGLRDYDPETGRWTCKDPIRFEGEDTNLYGYADNDPINYVDSFGLTKTVKNPVNPKNPPPLNTGYKPPKKNPNPRRVPAPGGKGETGYPDSKGRVWVPDNNMDGGPGWRVHYPDGEHEHVYPGGKVRTHNASSNACPAPDATTITTGTVIGISAYILWKIIETVIFPPLAASPI